MLPAGKQLQLPGLAFCDTDSGLQGLLFPPALVLCSIRGKGSKPAAVVVADGCRDSLQGGLQMVEFALNDLASCNLEDISVLLEEGHLDVASLDKAAADMLLKRCMAAGDDELLLMLVQADACLRCSMMPLQQLLEYACKVGLLACWHAQGRAWGARHFSGSCVHLCHPADPAYFWAHVLLLHLLKLHSTAYVRSLARHHNVIA